MRVIVVLSLLLTGCTSDQWAAAQPDELHLFYTSGSQHTAAGLPGDGGIGWDESGGMRSVTVGLTWRLGRDR